MTPNAGSTLQQGLSQTSETVGREHLTSISHCGWLPVRSSKAIHYSTVALLSLGGSCDAWGKQPSVRRHSVAHLCAVLFCVAPMHYNFHICYVSPLLSLPQSLAKECSTGQSLRDHENGVHSHALLTVFWGRPSYHEGSSYSAHRIAYRCDGTER